MAFRRSRGAGVQINVPPPLERLSSLVTEEESRESKRFRNTTGTFSMKNLSANGPPMAQDTSLNDDNMSSSGDEFVVDGSEEHIIAPTANPDTGKATVSYAKVVAGSSGLFDVVPYQKCDEEVVIVDEDVRVIRDGCGKPALDEGDNLGNSDKAQESFSNDKMFESWMLAKNKRRRQWKALKSDNGDGNTERLNLGLRFEVLRDEFEVTEEAESNGLDNTILKDTTVLGGSGARISKRVNSKDNFESSVLGDKVIALQQGMIPHVSARSSLGTNGRHKAVMMQSPPLKSSHQRDLVQVGSLPIDPGDPKLTPHAAATTSTSIGDDYELMITERDAPNGNKENFLLLS
ncbi:hypothetical protein V6N13_096034 [Hibiscus sabdariffa]|uniref:Uncharacterized protein n=1 Tax=Hibiscus sabdariffa TaxID=183260 RepID=A0ABR2DGX6_9ROSI